MTRFYSLTDTTIGKMEELDKSETPGFSHDVTLAMCNIASISQNGGKINYGNSHFVVQVTSKMVLLVNLLTGMREATWQEDGEIVAASVNASQICVALSGRRLYFLRVDSGNLLQLRYVLITFFPSLVTFLSLVLVYSPKIRVKYRAFR